MKKSKYKRFKDVGGFFILESSSLKYIPPESFLCIYREKTPHTLPKKHYRYAMLTAKTLDQMFERAPHDDFIWTQGP